MDDKVIVITGASAGIGAAMARQLGKEGHKLVLAARRDAELKTVAEQTATEAITVVCDARQRAQIDDLRDKAIEKFGHVDVWVNNAGRGISRSILELKEDELDEMICINLKSAWYGMQAIIPHFQERKMGHLINVSTFLSRVPFVTFRAAYSASKAALNILTANLRMDLAKDYPDIHISLVMPGAVSTDFFKNALGGVPQTSLPRSVMNAQTADEAAAAIVSMIKDPKPEIYTNPTLADTAMQYLQDVGAFEERLRKTQ